LPGSRFHDNLVNDFNNEKTQGRLELCQALYG